MDNELKKKILFAGYYDDDGKTYIVEIYKGKLMEALKKEFKAKEIKLI